MKKVPKMVTALTSQFQPDDRFVSVIKLVDDPVSFVELTDTDRQTGQFDVIGNTFLCNGKVIELLLLAGSVVDLPGVATAFVSGFLTHGDPYYFRVVGLEDGSLWRVQFEADSWKGLDANVVSVFFLTQLNDSEASMFRKLYG